MSITRRAAFMPLAILVLVLAACDLSSSPSAPASVAPSDLTCQPEEVADGGIDGRVVDVDGNPLADILVLITTGGFQGDVRTGEDGVFTAPGVSGDFEITTTDIDYQPVNRRVTVQCGELVEVELVLTPAGG